MQHLDQSPTDPAFVQNPYPFYERARAGGPLFFWNDYGIACATSAAAVGAILRDRRLGRAVPFGAVPEHLRSFYALEAHSLLSIEPPAHTRLRGLVLRAFTSRRIAGLQGDISTICETLIGQTSGRFDLIELIAKPLPVIVIARLLGVAEEMAPNFLAWSNAMVAMYQARRSPGIEREAGRAAAEFTAFMAEAIDEKRRRPGDDLLSHLIAAEAEGERLSRDEMIATCILLMNAGHEATVHTLGNGVKALLDHADPSAVTAGRIDSTVEEILRFDPPLHLFTRRAYEDVEFAGTVIREGEDIGCLLAAAGRDPSVWDEPARFNPRRAAKPHVAFGAGIHFCVGAPLARLELQVALPAIFARFPGLRIVEPPRYADLYHFHGLERLMVEV